MKVFDREPKETGRDYALRILKWNIIHVELQPGTLLSENELAAELGLSRTPVREALIELSKVRIVEILPQRGSAVSLIDSRLFEEARVLREAVESAVTELMAKTASPEMIAELEENIHLQEYYLSLNQEKKIAELDEQFHKSLFIMTGMTEIYEMMQQMALHYDRIRFLSRPISKNERTVSDHKRILDAIAAHNPEDAVKQMKKHLSRQPGLDQDLLKQYPSYFQQESAR